MTIDGRGGYEGCAGETITILHSGIQKTARNPSIGKCLHSGSTACLRVRDALGGRPAPPGSALWTVSFFRPLVRLATGAEGQEEGDALLRRYLDEEISLAKLAATRGASRFELQESFKRLRVPIRLGPAILKEARDEVKVARDVE